MFSFLQRTFIPKCQHIDGTFTALSTNGFTFQYQLAGQLIVEDPGGFGEMTC